MIILEQDLGIGLPFVKGQNIPVKNCWHFFTDGNAIDILFQGKPDFRDAMNRIGVVIKDYEVIILAFVLMDTHIHFILYVEFEQCNRFIHEYLRRTSINIAQNHKERKKLKYLPLSHQSVDNDLYLKTVISYVLRNPVIGGLSYLPQDYPWSSGPLYFRPEGYPFCKEWTGTDMSFSLQELGSREQRILLKTRHPLSSEAMMSMGMIYPGNYVAVDLVEKLFRTHRSFFFFLGHSKEEDIESREGRLSYLTIPIQEMRQHKTEVCRELFGVENIKTLNPVQRLRLAKTLRVRYNCSVKQIVRICGLVYEEVKGDLR